MTCTMCGNQQPAEDGTTVLGVASTGDNTLATRSHLRDRSRQKLGALEIGIWSEKFQWSDTVLEFYSK